MTKVVEKIENVYLITLFINLILNYIVPYNLIVSVAVKTCISAILILIGGGILLYNLITNRKRLFSNHSIILYLFIIVYILSSITMMKYGVIDNIKTILWSSIIYGLIYSFFANKKEKQWHKLLKVGFYIISVLWSLAIIYGLWQFFNGIGYTIKNEIFVINKAQGFFYNRLFGIFMDPNYAAATSTVLLFFSMYLIVETKDIKQKVINILIGLLQFLYVVLSGSRTGLVMLFFGVLFGSLLYHRKIFVKDKKSKEFIQTISASVCALIILALSLVITEKLLVICLRNIDRPDGTTVTESILGREDLSGKEDISNLRFELWGDSFEIFSSRKILGVSPRNIVEYAKENFEDTLPARGYDTGSGLISVLIYTGIVGAIVIGIYIIIAITKVVKYILKNFNINNLNLFLMTVVAIIAIEAVLNQEVFFINSLNTGLFWLSLGAVMTTVNKKYVEDDEENANDNGAKKKEKVGIVTIHDADNYGSDLQAYATQKVIDNLGYDAYIIDHICKKIASEYGIKRIIAQKSIKKILETIIRIVTVFPARLKFIAFRDKYYKLKPKDVNQDEYKKFVVGSDQVWNNKITGMDKDYFLDFVTDDNKKIAFSSSFGITKVPDELKEEYIELLNKLKNIAVREEQGANLVKELTSKEVPVVLDPTLLISKEEWIEASNMPYKEEGYIVCYQIAHSPSLAKFAEELAEKTGKKIISIQGSLRQRFNAKYIWNAGPSEYVGLIQNADYVVTNSFHGTAFSINLNKKFFTELLPSFEKTSSRLENILDTFDLRSRQIVDGKNDNMLADIDYDTVNKKLEEEKKKSIEILKTFIES